MEEFDGETYADFGVAKDALVVGVVIEVVEEFFDVGFKELDGGFVDEFGIAVA